MFFRVKSRKLPVTGILLHY